MPIWTPSPTRVALANRVRISKPTERCWFCPDCARKPLDRRVCISASCKGCQPVIALYDPVTHDLVETKRLGPPEGWPCGVKLPYESAISSYRCGWCPIEHPGDPRVTEATAKAQWERQSGCRYCNKEIMLCPNCAKLPMEKRDCLTTSCRNKYKRERTEERLALAEQEGPSRAEVDASFVIVPWMLPPPGTRPRWVRTGTGNVCGMHWEGMAVWVVRYARCGYAPQNEVMMCHVRVWFLSTIKRFVVACFFDIRNAHFGKVNVSIAKNFKFALGPKDGRQREDFRYIWFVMAPLVRSLITFDCFYSLSPRCFWPG